MKAAQLRLPAILCALILPLCGLIVHPILEMGLSDDFSYAKSALTLAQTGHIAYVGWSTPIIGWQLYLGALFIRLFGFSFTVLRLSTLLVAMLTAFLAQRTFARTGLNPWNATLGTLTLILSPITLALTFSYMTDIGGLFCIILCFYACLRALQAAGTRERLGWIVFAALSNAVFGTVRQIAWLGVLVMVPCACWIMRKRPHVLRTGALACFVSYGFIFAALRWFAHTPYTQPNGGAGAGPFDLSGLIHLSRQVGRTFFEVPLLLLPLLVPFLLAVRRSSRNFQLATFCAAGALIVLSLALEHRWPDATWLAPYLENHLTIHGLDDGIFLQGERPIILNFGVRLILSAVLTAAIVSFFGFAFSKRLRSTRTVPTPRTPTLRELSTLLAPFACADLLLMVPRALHGQIFDRYMIIFMAVGIPFVVLLYQQHLRPRLPASALAMIALFAAYGLACTHDAFAMYRAFQTATDLVHAQGIPLTAIDGGFPTNGWTQIQTAGYLNSDEIVTPANAYVAHPPRLGPCTPQNESLVPVVKPIYSLSFDGNACGGSAGFAPVAYREWLGPHRVNIYIVRSAPTKPSR